MNIRRGETRDFEAYCRLGAEMDRFNAEMAPRNYKLPPNPARPKDYFEAIIKYSDHGFFVAEEDGKVVGILHLEQAEDPPHPTLVPMGWTRIAELLLDPEYRAQGVGKELLQKARDWTIEHGLRDIRFNVAAFNNDMLSFCVREGFLLKNQTMVIPMV